MQTFRADQVGSLLRPPELRRAWEQFLAGQLDRQSLTELEDQAITAALQRQRSVGIDIYTDGEFRRAAYMTVVIDAVEGFSASEAGPRLAWRADPGREVPPEVASFTLPVVSERLRPRRRIAGHEAAFLRAHAPGPFKVTLPSPAHFSPRSFRPGVTDRAYATPSELTHDLGAILAEEAATLAREGVSYIQIDSPTYSAWLEGTAQEQRPIPAQQLAEAIAADNAILDAARAGGAVTALHICRGNASGAWLTSGDYEPIAEQVFGELHCDRFLLEYDTERAGGFEPLRLVPEPKLVVLGLVSTKYGQLESRDQLLRRIEAASAFVPIERLALSPQCGFASNFRGNPLSEEEQWRKLELVVSVAREVWGQAS
jgi:5-methyltetrahydropteroyltriglutamate--homocysteine methyltransferase